MKSKFRQVNTSKTLVEMTGWIALLALIASILTSVHQMNQFAPSPRTKHITAAAAKTEKLYSKIEKLGEFTQGIKLVSGVIEMGGTPFKYLFALPGHWKFRVLQNPAEFIDASLPKGQSSEPCLMMTTYEDGMPLWEAFSFGKTMVQSSGIPYASELEGEISVSGMPTVVSKIYLSPSSPHKQSDPYFLNALLVRDHSMSITLRTCQNVSPGSPRSHQIEDDFYRIVGGFNLEPFTSRGKKTKNGRH